MVRARTERKKRAKLPDIQPRDPDNCVEHAFSVMRLALGYKTGLPRGWDDDEGAVRKIEEWAFKAFPRHDVAVIWAETDDFFSGEHWDDYLLAFIYSEKGSDSGHVVIGGPHIFGSMHLCGVIAVRIERKY